MRHIIASAMLIAASIAAPLSAQPTTRLLERGKYVFTMPPGFEKLEAAGHVAICEPQHSAWVKKTLTEMKPATRPTTQPTDLIQKATALRGEIIKSIVTDIGIADEKALGEFYDTKLLPTLKKYDELKPPVYFMVVTRAKLKELTKAKWGQPRFYYNEASDLPVWDETIVLSIDRPVEEAVIVCYINDSDAEEDRTRKLTAQVLEIDTKLHTIADRAQLDVFNLISQHIGRTYFEPLKLRRDQVWFALGSAAVVTTKYTAQITGRTRESLIANITREERVYPVSAASIDLTKPLEESQLRPAIVPHYTQAMRRKGAAAVQVLTEKAGDGAIAKILAELKATPPADGPALLKLIKDRTNVDLTKEAGAK